MDRVSESEKMEGGTTLTPTEQSRILIDTTTAKLSAIFRKQITVDGIPPAVIVISLLELAGNISRIHLGIPKTIELYRDSAEILEKQYREIN
jgi:hypothetical protein